MERKRKKKRHYKARVRGYSDLEGDRHRTRLPLRRLVFSRFVGIVGIDRDGCPSSLLGGRSRSGVGNRRLRNRRPGAGGIAFGAIPNDVSHLTAVEARSRLESAFPLSVGEFAVFELVVEGIGGCGRGGGFGRRLSRLSRTLGRGLGRLPIPTGIGGR